MNKRLKTQRKTALCTQTSAKKIMRTTTKLQFQLGEIDIASIRLDPRSRDDLSYHLQTLKDNVQLFTPEILDEVNQVVVQAGHKLKKRTPWRQTMPN